MLSLDTIFCRRLYSADTVVRLNTIVDSLYGTDAMVSFHAIISLDGTNSVPSIDAVLDLSSTDAVVGFDAISSLSGTDTMSRHDTIVSLSSADTVMGSQLIALLLAEGPGGLESFKPLWTNDLGANESGGRDDDATATVGDFHGLVVRVASFIQAYSENLIEACLLKHANELLNKCRGEDWLVGVGNITLWHELELSGLEFAVEDTPGVGKHGATSDNFVVAYNPWGGDRAEFDDLLVWGDVVVSVEEANAKYLVDTVLHKDIPFKVAKSVNQEMPSREAVYT